MDVIKDALLELKDRILFDIISYVTILNVEVKGNFDNTMNIYIHTSDLGTIEYEKLKELEYKYSTNEIEINISIPDNIQIKGDEVEINTNLVCVYFEIL